MTSAPSLQARIRPNSGASIKKPRIPKMGAVADPGRWVESAGSPLDDPEAVNGMSFGGKFLDDLKKMSGPRTPRKQCSQRLTTHDGPDSTAQNFQIRQPGAGFVQKNLKGTS